MAHEGGLSLAGRFRLQNGAHATGHSDASGFGPDIFQLIRRSKVDAPGSPVVSQDGYIQLEPAQAPDDAPPAQDSSGPTQKKARTVQMPQRDNAKVACGKAISILMKMENTGYCGVETSSVYGAAVALPQIARSADWSGTLTALAVRSYIFLLLNILLQAFLLSMIGQEQLVMYPFAGKVHLCDFGASIPQCPDAADCRGPGGTEYSPPRLYGYSIWATRMYIRDSLKTLFPDRADEIHASVDPGEYGMENYCCRMACILIFMMAVVNDLHTTSILAMTLISVPSRAEPWILYEVPDWEEKDKVKEFHDLSELELVKFRVAGMPLGWKVLNFIIVLVPKCALWAALVLSGVHFLMETAGIMDLVVNAMALTFVLDVDEMIFSRLTTTVTQHIMSNLEDLPLFNTELEDSEENEEVLDRFTKNELGWRGRLSKATLIFPKRLAVVVLLQIVFMWIYYTRNCVRSEDGSFISKDMHPPEDLTYRPLQLMFGIASEEDETVFWRYPS